MNGQTPYPAYDLSPDKFTVDLSFGGNDVGAPVSVRSERGMPNGVAIARTGVGLYVITFGAGFVVPSAARLVGIHVTAEPVNVAGAFMAVPLAGNTLTTTRTLSIQCLDAAFAAVELPAGGTSRVNVQIAFVNNTGA